MKSFDSELLKSLYTPPSDSHKAKSGKVLLIGGSRLFHAASLWSLETLSRIVDMVFYASVPENNELVARVKKEFRNGIVIPRQKIDDYIKEADVVLIGPGLPRDSGKESGDDDTKELTEHLLEQYPEKKWVIDGGSLQVMDPELIPSKAILTPHKKEFGILFQKELKNGNYESREKEIEEMSKKFNCVILHKGEVDVVCSPSDCVQVPGGNAGMTKGGTGDVLAGLAAALYAKNDAFLSATSASYINKKAGESLFKRVGYYFNASDLADEIPKVMKELIIQ